MKIKKARNEVVHEGKEPRKEIVEKCLKLFLEMVTNRVGTQLGMKLDKL